MYQWKFTYFNIPSIFHKLYDDDIHNMKYQIVKFLNLHSSSPNNE